jgi:hypothetical protein
MPSAINEIDIEFEEIKNVNIETIGSLSQITLLYTFILLFFVLLVVLINCMDSSIGRVTTALSVHGTTVIPQGTLVNDIYLHRF